MDHANRWRVNETLLQSYRSIFISSQSFFLGVGVYISQLNEYFFLIVFLIAQYIIWKIWKEVVFCRSLIVDYHKFQMDRDLGLSVSEDEYVKDSSKRLGMNKELGIERNIRDTRMKMDVIIPNLYSVIWVGIGVVLLLKYLP